MSKQLEGIIQNQIEIFLRITLTILVNSQRNQAFLIILKA